MNEAATTEEIFEAIKVEVILFPTVYLYAMRLGGCRLRCRLLPVVTTLLMLRLDGKMKMGG